jgi:FMN reductase
VVRLVRLAGLGGSLRAASTSLTALKAALEGATAAGAEVQLISVRDLGLPLYIVEHATPAGAHEFAAAGGVQGLQAVISMEFIARALRGWSVPLVLPVPQAWRSFDPDGHLTDEAIARQLRALGAEVVRAARQFQAEGTCDYADDKQFAAHGHPVQSETRSASYPASDSLA